MGAKRANSSEIEKFRRDLNDLLRNKGYSSRNIASRIGVDPANLSNYRSGIKAPGRETINKFYLQFGEETKAALYEDRGDFPKAEEAQLKYLERNYQDELIDVLKSNNDFLKEELKIINRTHEKTTSLFQMIVESTQEMAKSVTTLIETNRKLTTKP
ncbi:MAG TPA: hypothetical protein VNW04_14215 [Puia sp.]|jgi:transcriptional regulator with XRE-family HTH domain|nr:hypothetical protein [Puia sp.]